jgi:hypothetical protein
VHETLHHLTASVVSLLWYEESAAPGAAAAKMQLVAKCGTANSAAAATICVRLVVLCAVGIVAAVHD